MSDDELSDDMHELNELIAEYLSKEEEKERQNESTEANVELVKCKVNQNDGESKNKEPKSISMDKVLFGDKAKLLKNFEKAVKKTSNFGNDDRNEEDNELPCSKDQTKQTKKRKPVWEDVDDEKIQLRDVKGKEELRGRLSHLKMDKSYKDYLTSKFARIVNQPKWASLDETQKKSSDDEQEDAELLRTVGFLSKPPSSILASGNLSAKRLKDLNRATYAEGYVNSIQFHPSSTAALVAGEKGIASIYAVDGTQNEKLHNIRIRKFPIRCARILPCGTKAVFGSVTRYAYLYDLMTAKEACFKLRLENGNLSLFEVSSCGRYLASAGLDGEIHIYEAKTFEIIRTFKQNDNIASLCFTADSHRLLVKGTCSYVYIFSMRQQKLEHKFIDDGCISGSAMDLSPNQRLLAAGSREGAVNVYDFDNVMISNAPQPQKTFLNLTTGVNCVRFNHSSELLAFSSNICNDAVKIAHFPSATVYSNFPGNMSKLGTVHTLEFSPHSAYFALGSKDKCPLFRIKHFENY